MRVQDWEQIHNPATGERLRFLGRDAVTDSISMEVTFPVKGRPVVEHRHPGQETFEVVSGILDLTVNRQLYRLGSGEQFTVTTEFHFHANTGLHDAVAIITASPADFAERGIRTAFWLAADNGVTRSGRPRDLLALALVSENGAHQIAGPPQWLWVALMTVLGRVAVLAGKRRKVQRYWPPDLMRPWRR